VDVDQDQQVAAAHSGSEGLSYRQGVFAGIVGGEVKCRQRALDATENMLGNRHESLRQGRMGDQQDTGSRKCWGQSATADSSRQAHGGPPEQCVAHGDA